MPERKAGTTLHRRTLRFAVSIASLTAFPQKQLIGGHAVGPAYWYKFQDGKVSEEDIKQITSALNQLIQDDAKIQATSLPFKTAYDYFSSHHQPLAASLISTKVQPSIACWSCSGQYRLRLTPLLASTGGLTGCAFSLRAYRGGFLAIYDTEGWTDQPAIADSFADHMGWGNTTSVRSVGQLNELFARGGRSIKDYVLSSEFRQEFKLSQIARMIHARGSGQPSSVRVLCIAGPTSSGKTTFASKLSLYLRNLGYTAKALSVDHYYHSLPDQPKFKIRQERKDVDYDALESMDVKLVSEHVNALIDGKTVMTPQYSFVTGLREGKGHEFSLPSNGILVMEGIHALNPQYTVGIRPECVFRIYISPLTALLVDDFNAVKTTNHRFLRRLARDSQFRGYKAGRVLQMWPKVRNGEHLYIFPHQNGADFVMNSAAEYEISVLKSYTQHLLSSVSPSQDGFTQAQEVLNLLQFFSDWPAEYVPSTALLREFIGDGAFDHH